MNTFQLSILAANKDYYDGPCESLIVPTPDGQYGIMANHSNVIMAVMPGSIYYTVPGQGRGVAIVSEGMVKVEDNEVLILVDSAEHPDEVDENQAKREQEEAAEAALQQRSNIEFRSAQAELIRATARLRGKKEFEAGNN